MPTPVFKLLTLCIALLAAGCSTTKRPRPAADPTSERVTRSGKVVGFAGDYGSHTWLGIPYAQPPVGSLRWRAPRPAAPWSGTRETLEPPSPCIQLASNLGGVDGKRGSVVGSEDCLYLNVYAPRLGADELPKGSKALPVMLWIHGGGNTIGAGTFYNGGNLAVTEKVIVITFNYRLGPLGWFRHPALGGEGTSPEDRSGNYGTLDIVRALHWVHDNAAAFGGDPNRVTIFGESAGGVNVVSMLVSPLAGGLFHRAIVQSGGLWTDSVERGENFADADPPGDAHSSNEILAKLLTLDDEADDRAAAKDKVAHMTPVQMRSYLYAKSPKQLFAAYDSEFAPGLIDMPKLFRDGVVLPRQPVMERFAQADGYNRVPVMIGSNRDENKLFMFGDPELVRNYFWLFPRLRDPRWYDLSAEYLAKMWKASGVDQPARALSSHPGQKVYGYRFDWDEEPTVLGTDLAQLLGAAHAFEIPFVFGHFDLGKEANQIYTEDNRAGREQLSKQMMSYWAELAYNGDPGKGRRGELPPWPAWQGDGPYVVFDSQADGGLELASETYSKESLLAAAGTDPRLRGPAERCRLMADFTLRSRALTAEEYARTCAQYPLPREE